MNTKLTCLTDNELISRLKELVRNEKELTENVIYHLREVSIRRLYAQEGYSSLFDYATRGLGYSMASAMRRVKAARAAVKHPKLVEYLQTGELTLSTVDICGELLLENQSEELLEALRGKSVEEAKKIQARLNPVSPSKLRDRIEPVCSEGACNAQEKLFPEKPEENTSLRSEVNYKISFTADAEFKENLTRAQELMFSGDKDELALSHVLGVALQEYIKRHCPKKRLERRNARRLKKEERSGDKFGTEKKNVDFVGDKNVAATGKRKIPVWLRDEVLARDGYCCTYISPEGHRCGVPWDLEVDHIKPFARGGLTTASNLRVLCSTHNFLAELKEFGAKFVQDKIESASANYS